MAQRGDLLKRKRLNTQILIKTEKALEAIKMHDLRQQRLHVRYDEKTIMNKLDEDFIKYTSHKPLQLDKTYKITIHNHNQEFYFLDMQKCLFPIRLFLKNIKNTGTLYIGYDKQYPGVSSMSKLSFIQNENSKETFKSKNYDLKIILDKEKLVTLKNRGNDKVNKIYFSYISGSQLLILDFRVQFLGFIRDERFVPEMKSLVNIFNTPQKKSLFVQEHSLIRLKTQPVGALKQFIRTDKSIKLQKINKDIKLQEFKVFGDLNRESKHNISQINFKLKQKQQKNNKDEKKQKSQSLIALKLNKITQNSFLKGFNESEVNLRIEQVHKNKELIVIYKQKDKQIRQKASEGKFLIERYQKIYKQESVKKRILNRQLSILIYSVIFTQKVYKTYHAKKIQTEQILMVQHLCLKFAKKLMDAHKYNCSLLNFKKERVSHEAMSGIIIQSKIIAKRSIVQAQTVIRETLFAILPQLMLKECIQRGHKYRNGIRFIQRVWIVKYNNRKSALLYFLDNHVQKMLKQFPHFSIFTNQFYTKRINNKLIIQYIKDQSQKYRYIYDSYLKKVQQIKEMIQMSKKNIKQSKSTCKLIIPNLPLKPIHRFFRNLDILKSMARTWFQIQYKKYIKKSDKYK